MACTQKYDFNWSRGVWNRFIEVHPRGWQILNVLLNYSTNRMVWNIATGDPEWEQIKGMVHCVDKWLDSSFRCLPEPPRVEFTTQMYSILVRVFEKKVSPELLYALTNGIKRIELNSQAFRSSPEEYDGELH